ncbi:hypothetical protein [Bradyrhizobium sp. 195]|uniref:hypothetical protein n=1 Tax=Bradyrhizobium sp. 195 TaxID=2782662 RepID=UPI0020010461|nr:hypothetical protein [Bradyrhizobium sp. 195]UPK31470.1 hypothetical protein IVB26_41555 [Bradyrhizobium sp. 195]
MVPGARFGKTLPSEAADRLRNCPQEDLDEMLRRSAVAPTIEEATMVRLDGAGAVIFDTGSRVSSQTSPLLLS